MFKAKILPLRRFFAEAMTDQEPVEVYERWQMKNGEFAVIQFRLGPDATGHVEGSEIPHAWTDGKSAAGSGYDLCGLEPKP